MNTDPPDEESNWEAVKVFQSSFCSIEVQRSKNGNYRIVGQGAINYKESHTYINAVDYLQNLKRTNCVDATKVTKLFEEYQKDAEAQLVANDPQHRHRPILGAREWLEGKF